MTVGITTFNLADIGFQQQLSSLLTNNIQPDFIILHYGRKTNAALKYYRFLKKTIRQYRLRSLAHILNRYKITGTTVEKKFTLTESEKRKVASFLEKARIIRSKGINDPSTIDDIRNFKIGVIVCNSGILKEQALSLTDVVFLNIHASKLPQYRGMNNVEWALLEGNDVYVTIHKISRRMDEGDILYQEKIDLPEKKLTSIEDYREYCFFKSNQVIGKALDKFKKKEVGFIPQEKKGEKMLQYYVMHPLLKKRLQEKLRG